MSLLEKSLIEPPSQGQSPPPVEVIVPGCAPDSRAADGEARNVAAPVVFASPHSGNNYPRAFVDQSSLDPVQLRGSEDAFVDEIFAAAPHHGATLVRATFPRVYVDANREPFELDPEMFEDTLPDYVNSDSPRAIAGIGTIARLVSNGKEIYTEKLRFDDAKARIETCHTPYHKALSETIETIRKRFGGCLLIDCHSMPSTGGLMDHSPGYRKVDMILGDCHGTSCAPDITDTAEQALQAMGYVVARNKPYAGGYTTRHYGQPGAGIHTLQIEIKRSLYMDEIKMSRNSGMETLTANIDNFIAALTAIAPSRLAPDAPNK